MRNSTKLLIPTLAVSALLAACGGSSSNNAANSSPATQTTASPTQGGSAAVVKTASSSALGKTVLVDSQGMTLYALSGEQGGKFICSTSSCESVWHPLTAQAGSVPSGTVSSLGTVKRPDGTVQVTYKSMPLYTFAQDHAPGEANGQGVKDVGTWNAVPASGEGGAPAATSMSSSSSSSAAGGYGGYGY
jgi:predicted lipoprotein with Yx(FWY)xxD motif